MVTVRVDKAGDSGDSQSRESRVTVVAVRADKAGDSGDSQSRESR